MLKNTENSYGIVAVLIHWLMAIAIIGTFLLGLWMVDLDYYHEWYKSGPDFHYGIGILIFIALIFRLLWRIVNTTPKHEENMKQWEIKSAISAHYLLYILTIVVSVTGYLILTADGRPIDVFGWFEVPATITSISDQADRAGELHYYLSILLMVISGVHALAALKHHFIDKDKTLVRMFGKK